MSRNVCVECGARLDDGAERCDLCGAPNKSAAESRLEPTRLEGETGPGESGSKARDQRRVAYCNACGWKNPPGARFCSDCGSKLRSHPPDGTSSKSVVHSGVGRVLNVRPAVSPERWRETGEQALPPGSGLRSGPSAAEDHQGLDATSGKADAAMTRQIVMLVGLAVMVVMALYLVTVVSSQRPPDPVEDTMTVPIEARSGRLIREAEALPISDRYRGPVDSLQNAIEAAPDGERVVLTQELVDLLTAIGRVDRAAIEQMRLAGETDAPDDWKSAGRLLLDWMERSEPDLKPEIAQLAIDAYNRVLTDNPDDLEARADLGWAYQYDPQRPMEAIRQTNLVLEADAEHLAANYNKGVFLMRINRLDQAREQFERVQQIAAADSPYQRQARMWIETIREARESRR